jgi:hypothetical protein
MTPPLKRILSDPVPFIPRVTPGLSGWMRKATTCSRRSSGSRTATGTASGTRASTRRSASSRKCRASRTKVLCDHLPPVNVPDHAVPWQARTASRCRSRARWSCTTIWSSASERPVLQFLRSFLSLFETHVAGFVVTLQTRTTAISCG